MQTPCAHRFLDGSRDPARCESSPGRCDRRHARGADICARRNFSAESARPSSGRKPRPTLRVRARDPALPSRATRPCAIVDVLAAAHRVGEMHFPIVAIVDVRQRGRDSAFGHHRVRFTEQHLQTIPTETPAAEASIAARKPAPPAPMTRTSCSKVSYSGMRMRVLRKDLDSRARCPSSKAAHKGRRTRPRTDSSRPKACGDD